MENGKNSMVLSSSQQLFNLGREIKKLFEGIQEINPEVSNLNRQFQKVSSQIDKLGKSVSEVEKESQERLALVDVGRVINSSLKLQDVLRIVMDTIIRLTEAERGFLMLKDKDGTLSMRTARNWEQESIPANEFAISRTVVNRVVNEGNPIVTTNAQEDPRFDGQESVIFHNLRSILCVPLKVKGELTGVIYADNRIRSGIFTQTERDLLTAFSNQAAVAIDNAQLFESVRSTLDEVTELKNLMDNIFASIASGVITADIEDKIILCNLAAEKILGKPAVSIVGKTIDDSLPLLANELSLSILDVRNTDQPILGIELNPTLPDRGQVDLVLSLSPLKDATKSTQGIAIVLDDLTEKKQLEAQRQLFERMVPPAVIDQIDLNKIQLGGERAKITTLFADIRGYTSFSESLPPEQLVSILNLYLGAAAEVVMDEEGTLDKFMGDAVMAIFNAPIPQKDHTLRAVKAAVNFREAIKKVRNNLPPAFQLGFGIGIHYGDAVLGLVGTEKRLDYTAIGDSVNTAKRIQENAKEGQILISKPAFYNVKDLIHIKNSDPIYAKGKKETVEVFEIIGVKNSEVFYNR